MIERLNKNMSDNNTQYVLNRAVDKILQLDAIEFIPKIYKCQKIIPDVLIRISSDDNLEAFGKITDNGIISLSEDDKEQIAKLDIICCEYEEGLISATLSLQYYWVPLKTSTFDMRDRTRERLKCSQPLYIQNVASIGDFVDKRQYSK